MKRVSFFKGNRSDNLLHIETEGCIVNIRIDLHNADSCPVTSIEILPDKDEGWVTTGDINNRVYQPKPIIPR